MLTSSSNFSSHGVETWPQSKSNQIEFEAGSSVSFAQLYDAWFRDVRRWVRALGAPVADADDLAQEVFIIVRRKLPDFRSGNFPGWLFRITQRTVRDLRRKAWFRHSQLQAATQELDDLPANGAEPSEAYERVESFEVLARLLARMSPKRREAFLLFEVEGYSGEEIAALKQIPLATVWTRLHHARKDLSRMVLDLE